MLPEVNARFIAVKSPRYLAEEYKKVLNLLMVIFYAFFFFVFHIVALKILKVNACMHFFIVSHYI